MTISIIEQVVLVVAVYGLCSRPPVSRLLGTRLNCLSSLGVLEKGWGCLQSFVQQTTKKASCSDVWRGENILYVVFDLQSGAMCGISDDKKQPE